MGLIEAFEKYLSEALDLKVEAKPWKGAAKLPIFLGQEYDFHLITVLGTSCVVAIAKEENSPAIVAKHLKTVREKWDGPCIYVCEGVSSYNRKRLIEHRIPFVVPGNQVYFPDLGIDLREYFHKKFTRAKHLSPSTQLVVIFALIHSDKEKFIPSELAKELGVSAMTMTRAFDELESLEIATIQEKGRERWLIFKKTGKALWEQVKSLLRDPVRKRIWLRQKKGSGLGIRSGLSALSDSSMLGEPDIPVYALDAKAWKNLRQTHTVEEIPSGDGADMELEIWIYNPKLFARDGLVDPFSLYLSLKEIKDERVEAALDQLMEKIKW